MRYRSFAVANAVGGIAWALIVVLLGYPAGASFTHIQALLGRVSLAITSSDGHHRPCDVDRVAAPRTQRAAATREPQPYGAPGGLSHRQPHERARVRADPDATEVR